MQQATDSGLASRRAWGSNGESLGLHAEVDLVIDGFKVQAKRRKSLPAYIKPNENVDLQIIREDHGRSLVVMDYFDLLDILRAAKAGDST